MSKSSCLAANIVKCQALRTCHGVSEVEKGIEIHHGIHHDLAINHATGCGSTKVSIDTALTRGILTTTPPPWVGSGIGGDRQVSCCTGGATWLTLRAPSGPSGDRRAVHGRRYQTGKKRRNLHLLRSELPDDDVMRRYAHHLDHRWLRPMTIFGLRRQPGHVRVALLPGLGADGEPLPAARFSSTPTCAAPLIKAFLILAAVHGLQQRDRRPRPAGRARPTSRPGWS